MPCMALAVNKLATCP